MSREKIASGICWVIVSLQLLFAAYMLLIPSGCCPANQSRSAKVYHINQFSGGQSIGRWDADNYQLWGPAIYFLDKETGTHILIAGDFQITEN